MQKKYTVPALSFFIFAAIVNMGCEDSLGGDEYQINHYAQIRANLSDVDTLHFFNENTQSGNHVLDYYGSSINASRSFPYVSLPPFGSTADSGITFDLVEDITTGPNAGLWLPVTESYFEDARTGVNGAFWFQYVFDFNYGPNPFSLPLPYLDSEVSAPIESWELEPLEIDTNNIISLSPFGSGLSFLNRYIGYNKVTKTLEFYELVPPVLLPELFYAQTEPLTAPGAVAGNTDNIWHVVSSLTLTKVDSITFKEHALWSRDGNPFLDKEKTWKIIEIRDSVGTLLNSSGYDCLYDNTFTFSAGNSLKLDIGLVHCASIDQPLLNNGVTEVFQQYTVVTDSITVSPYPYVYITTPGALFAPQRMFMISFDQETAELSTKYGTDSITLKVQAI